ncbi:YfbR-like 5'-deoxynucleotidase [Lutibaculum baratangense]|nr:HD family hydrolase [Lutibaculum baratangense]
MLSGRRLDLMDPSPLDVEIEDVAHGLARVARWNGQTIGVHAYSVAQHSLLVEELVWRIAPKTETRWRLAALLHDAPEYVIGDIISPFKAVLGDSYKAVEHRILAAVHLRFGLPARLPERVTNLIKRADQAAAYLEATQLAGFSREEAHRLFRKPARTGGHDIESEFQLVPVPTGQAEARYLERFDGLCAASETSARPCPIS